MQSIDKTSKGRNLALCSLTKERDTGGSSKNPINRVMDYICMQYILMVHLLLNQIALAILHWVNKCSEDPSKKQKKQNKCSEDSNSNPQRGQLQFELRKYMFRVSRLEGHKFNNIAL